MAAQPEESELYRFCEISAKSKKPCVPGYPAAAAQKLVLPYYMKEGSKVWKVTAKHSHGIHRGDKYFFRAN